MIIDYVLCPVVFKTMQNRLLLENNTSITSPWPCEVDTCKEERLSLPPLLDVDEQVENREKEESKAGGDQHVGHGPQVLVDRHPALVLAGPAQTSAESPWNMYFRGLYSVHPKIKYIVLI